MRTYSDSYLMSLKKADLINLIRCAEHNEQAAEATLEQHIKNVKDWMPIVHGHWIKNDDHEGWHCSVCKKDDVYAYSCDFDNKLELQDLYCPNCGAKMDEEIKEIIDDN